MFLSPSPSNRLQESNLLTFCFLLYLPLIVDAVSTTSFPSESHALSTSVVTSNTTIKSFATPSSVEVVSSVKTSEISSDSILPTSPSALASSIITSGSATGVSSASGSVIVVSSSSTILGIVSPSMSTSKPAPSEPPVVASSTSKLSTTRPGPNAPAPPPTQIFQDSTSIMVSSSTPLVSNTTRGPLSSTTTIPPKSTSVPASDSTRGNVISTPIPSASNTNVPAPPPPPKSTSTPPRVSETSSHIGSVITSVTVVQAPQSQPRTMTVTESATTTFSSPVVLTSTALDGSKIITTPALVTVLSTSTEPNGALTTVTQVVANPPNFASNEQLSKNGNDLSHKPGLLAGICVIAGLVAALAIIGAVFCLRRNRRIARRRRWLAGMQQQRPTSLTGDPFRDPLPISKEAYSDQHASGGPVMQTVDLHRDDSGRGRWEQQRHSNGGASSSSPRPYEPRNLFTLYPDPHPQMQPVHFSAGSPSSENHELENVGLAYSTNLTVPVAQFKRHSLTPSSPSIYPASLPPDDQGDDGFFQGQELRSSENSVVPVLKPEIPARSPARRLSESASGAGVSATVPPRPPRSHLRESIAKVQQDDANAYKPLTPPASEPTSSKPPSPISEPRPQDVLNRRTLLDVRSRSISERA